MEGQTELWLVFYDEGLSLRHYLYTERRAEGFILHGQSAFWRDMRLDPKGPEVISWFRAAGEMPRICRVDVRQ